MGNGDSPVDTSIFQSNRIPLYEKVPKEPSEHAKNFERFCRCPDMDPNQDLQKRITLVRIGWMKGNVRIQAYASTIDPPPSNYQESYTSSTQVQRTKLFAPHISTHLTQTQRERRKHTISHTKTQRIHLLPIPKRLQHRTVPPPSRRIIPIMIILHIMPN